MGEGLWQTLAIVERLELGAKSLVAGSISWGYKTFGGPKERGGRGDLIARSAVGQVMPPSTWTSERTWSFGKEWRRPSNSPRRRSPPPSRIAALLCPRATASTYSVTTTACPSSTDSGSSVAHRSAGNSRWARNARILGITGCRINGPGSGEEAGDPTWPVTPIHPEDATVELGHLSDRDPVARLQVRPQALHPRSGQRGPEAQDVAVQIDVGPFAQLVGGIAYVASDPTTYPGTAPLRIEGVGVLHVEICLTPHVLGPRDRPTGAD